MQRLVSYRQGDRAEYLAQYILSSFAISVPVPRQEDIGSDFHCSLLRRHGQALRPYLPFNIQIKSQSEELIKNGVEFGGITKAGHWRHHEVEQLCQMETPFLIGLVNTQEQCLDLFSTITRFFVPNNWFGRGIPRSINFIPYHPTQDIHVGAGEAVDLEANGEAPRWMWRLPMGQPIISISIEDAEKEDRCEHIKAILEPYLRLDQENAVLARIGLGYFQWPLVMRPGNLPREIGLGLSCGLPSDRKFEMQRETMCKIVASILKSYHFAGLKAAIPQWSEVLKQLPLEKANPLIQQAVKDAMEFANGPAQD